MAAHTFSIRIDVRRNVMYLEQQGRPTAESFLRLKQAFVPEVEKLCPGFSIVNDQREMEPYDDEAMEVAKDLVEITGRFGATRVIRILPVDVFSAIKLSTTLIEARSRYTSIRVATPEEAEEALDTFS